jgi:hypothetical protein
VDETGSGSCPITEFGISEKIIALRALIIRILAVVEPVRNSITVFSVKNRIETFGEPECIVLLFSYDKNNT